MKDFKDAELSLIVESLGLYSKFLASKPNASEYETELEDIRAMLIKLLNENMKRWRAV